MTDKQAPSRSSISMHEGIAVWCDCCSCEIEPYWQAVAEELGIDLGSDYESARKAQGRGPSDEESRRQVLRTERLGRALCTDSVLFGRVDGA